MAWLTVGFKSLNGYPTCWAKKEKCYSVDVYELQVLETDGGVSLKPEEHKEVTEVATELQKYCISEPVKSPLIFGGKSKTHLSLCIISHQKPQKQFHYLGVLVQESELLYWLWLNKWVGRLGCCVLFKTNITWRWLQECYWSPLLSNKRDGSGRWRTRCCEEQGCILPSRIPWWGGLLER